jgi:hypothetical protein
LKIYNQALKINYQTMKIYFQALIIILDAVIKCIPGAAQLFVFRHWQLSLLTLTKTL